MKRCTQCGLSVDEGVVFIKHDCRRDGLSRRCKDCRNQYQKQYRQSKKGKVVRKRYQRSEKHKEYRRSEKHKEYLEEYRQTEGCRAAREKHKQTEKYKETQKKYRQTQKYKDRKKEYGQSEKRKAYLRSEGYKKKQKKYMQTEKGKAMKRRSYVKNRISCCLSTAIKRSLRRNLNGRQWEDIVGWTLQQFKRRFAQLFEVGMTWENHGAVWEIDHIEPLSAHNIISTDCTDFRRAWALSNLQPLFKEQNHAKSNKLKKHFQPTLF